MKTGRKETHGHRKRANTRSKEYMAWDHIIQRCYNKKCKNYPKYGGRGIRVCKRWIGKNGFANFLQDVGLSPTSKHSIDRIKNNGHYTKKNCRWATSVEQNNNSRRNTLVIYRGKKMSIAETARTYFKDYELVRNRIKLGWSIKRAMDTPKINRR